MASRGPELIDSEQRYQSVVAAMAEGVVLQDASLAILTCNEAAERILGLTRDQMVGRTSLDPGWRAIHEDGSPFPGETHPVPMTLATGLPQRDVIMGVHKPDGSLSWISINSLPLFRAGETTPHAAVCTFSDVTRHKQAERALAASEGRYRRIVETSLEGIWIADLETYAQVFANRRMAEILGVTPEELAGSSILSWLAPADAAIVRQKFAERADGRGEIYELSMRRRDGRVVPCSIAACPLEDPSGRQLTLAMVRDLSATRRTEQQLRESERRVEQAFRLARIGWFEENATRGTTTLSPQLRELLGIPPDVDFSFADFVANMPAEDRQALSTSRELLRASPAGARVQHEFRLNLPADRTRWLTVAVTRGSDPLSGDDLHLGVCTDITERKHLEDQLLQARKLEGIGRLAGGVAHDFNNLLTAILASVSFAERQLPEVLRGDLSTIRTAAERAAGLTRQLLAFARKQVIELRTLDLNAVVGDLEKMLRRLVSEHIDLACLLGPGLWPVRGDLNQLEQVVVNLVANARDAMPDGGKLTIETLNATIDASHLASHPEIAPGDYAVLAVADTGEGIDAATLQHIFEPFFTTKRSGTGLGLASVYGTVHQLGGHIWVYSEPGRGAVFKVYLPRAAEATAATSDRPAPRVAGAVHETLLVVEDDELLRRVVDRGLRFLGYRVLLATDGEDALAVAAGHDGEIHLVVTDVVMPRLSGRQMVERLRELRPTTKVLFVSGYTDNLVVRHGALEPGVELLAKPFTIDALAERVRELLDR